MQVENAKLSQICLTNKHKYIDVLKENQNLKDEKALTEYQEELNYDDFNSKYMINESEDEINQSFQYEIDPLINRQEFRKKNSKSFVKKENEIRLHRQSILIEPKNEIDIDVECAPQRSVNGSNINFSLDEQLKPSSSNIIKIKGLDVKSFNLGAPSDSTNEHSNIHMLSPAKTSHASEVKVNFPKHCRTKSLKFNYRAPSDSPSKVSAC